MALTRRSELPRFVTLTVPMCSRPHSNKVHASKRHSVCLPSLNILLPMTQPLQQLPHNPYTEHRQIRFVFCFLFFCLYQRCMLLLGRRQPFKPFAKNLKTTGERTGRRVGQNNHDFIACFFFFFYYEECIVGILSQKKKTGALLESLF